MAAAAAQAASTGTPVEVSDKTTDTTQVTAQPDGTFALTSSREPVRVQQNGAWHPIDTTLHANADGMLAPAATTTDVSFSNGGSSPIVQIQDGDKIVSYSWPHALPTPTVTGDTATYPGVLPGVDLKVKALPEGYDETLVVNDAQAAADPGLKNLTLTASAEGVNLAKASDGSISATDSTGQTVFAGATPVMWDSSNPAASQVGGPTTAFDPGSGDTTPLAVSVPTVDGLTAPASAPITLTPPAAALTGSDVTYPVYIDPEMAKEQQHWAQTFSGGNHYFDSGVPDLKVGYCDFGDCGSWYGQNGRAYFQVDMTALAQAGTVHIFTADVSAYEIHGSQGCTPEQVRLFTASDITAANTAWPGPSGGWLDTESSAAGDNCGGAGNVDFQNANVVSFIQGLANANTTRVNFALIANQESNDIYWKRFEENPTLTVHYNYYPNTPTELGVTGEVNCTSTHYTADTTPVLNAKATDGNPSALPLRYVFRVYPGGSTSSQVAGSNPTPQTSSGAQATWTPGAPLAVAATGTSYQYQTSVENVPNDPTYASPLWNQTPAAYYPFTILPAPTAMAGVSSLDFPAGNWGAPQGRGGVFTLTDGGAHNTVGYAYGWDSPSNIPTVTSCNYNQTTSNGGIITGGHTATLTAPNTLTSGPHTLWVRSFDAAHNMSPVPTASYSFYVSPYYNEGAVKTEAESPSANATVNGGGTLTTVSVAGDSNGQEVQLTGGTTGTTVDFTFTAAIEADYALGIELINAPNNGQLSFKLDTHPLTQADATAITANTASGSRTLTFLSLGGSHLTMATHDLQVTLTSGSQAAFDFITAIPINQVQAASFSAAMNNTAIAVDGTTPANMAMASNPSSGRGYSSTALANAGWSAGSTVTVGGATFTMPARNGAYDNVVATGQTIPLANPVKATAMGFIVASACSSTGGAPKTGQFNYSDGSPSTAYFPAIPDIVAGSADSAALNMSVEASGTGQIPNHVGFYVIFVPTDPTKTLNSVTLPNYGSNFLPCSPSVHIFAMGPRLISSGWEGTWAAPIDSATSPVGGASLANQTVRMIVHPTTSGTHLRVRLSNTANTAPITIDAATVAAQASSSDAATTATPQSVTFGGSTSITIPAGAEVFSDPATMPTGGSGNLAVSIHLPAAVTATPTHTAGNTTNYVGAGNLTATIAGTGFGYTTTNSYILSGVDVLTDPTSTDGTTVVLGDQTSATGAGPAAYRTTWVDDLPPQYNTDNGSPLTGGLVNASLQNRQTDWWASPDNSGTILNASVLDEPNLRNVVVSIGASDILAGVQANVIETNIKAIDQQINNARYGIANYDRPDGTQVPILLTTIPPLGLSASDAREIQRQQVNTDIINGFTNFSATGYVDLDNATTSDTPGSAAYYSDVANAIANAGVL